MTFSKMKKGNLKNQHMKKKKKDSVIKSAPLYNVLGSLKKGTELSIRVIPLTRAVKKNKSWVYPSEGGNKVVLIKDIGKLDLSDFRNKNALRKFYRGYCLKSAIPKLIKLIKTKHGSVKTITAPIVVSKPVVIKLNKKTNPITEMNTQPQKETIPEKVFSKIDQADIDAVNSILAGNKDKFSVLYKRYYAIINFRYVSSLKYDKDLADDLTADLFVRVFENLGSYKPQYTFNSWITRVAKNFLIDYTRKKRLDTISIDAGASSNKMKNEDADNTIFEVRDNGTLTPEEKIISKQRIECVKSSINKLDDRCRVIITKLFLEEKSYEEIALETDMSLNTVKSLIFRGKARLKTIMEADKSTLATLIPA